MLTERAKMELTITFLKLFFWSVYLTGPLLLFFVIIITGLGQIVGRIEKWTKFDSFYWSFITAATVGYGDIRPTSKSARLLSIAIAIIGMMFIGMLIALTIQAATVSFETHIDPSIMENYRIGLDQ
jgi:voltage-gated potassium channel